MLTDYERYQLEWMIEHGHSLKEFVKGLDCVDLDGIGSLEEAYVIWEQDYGFGGEIFSNEREFKEEDLPAMNVGAHDETPRQMVADTIKMPAKAVELIKSLYVVDGAMSQDHGIDYLFDNIGILTASVRDMLSRAAEREQWEGQYKSLIDKCEEMRGDEKWDCRDTGTLVDGFAKAVEHEADAAFEVARIKGELLGGAAYYNPETGDLIVSYLADYEDPSVEVFSAKTHELYDFTAQLTPDDIEYGDTTHELAGQFARHVATYHSVDELSSAGYLDYKNLLDVSGTKKLFKTGLAIAQAESSDIDLKGCGTVVTVDGHDYEVMKGATYEDSRKVDDLLDSHGDKPISDFRKQPQGMSLKQAVMESRAASTKLAEENDGTDAPNGKDER